MRAIQIFESGGAEALQVADVITPEPGPGEIRVRIEAAGVNFIDTYHRKGLYPLDLPTILGVEAGGVVNAVGPDVTTVSEGDRVAYCDQRGAYAEQQVVSATRVVRVPDEVEMRTAVSALLQGMTAHYLTRDTFSVGPKDTVLVHAAAGGVGHLLTQVCKQRGARVIATCGTGGKAALVRELGVDEVIVYTEERFTESVERITDGRGVDVVFDGVGRSTFLDGLTCLRPRGMMVLYGQASGPADPIDPQELNRLGSLFLTRPTLFHYVADRDDLELRAGDLFRWITDGELQVRIDRTFPLEEAADAHRHLEARKTRGKLLLIP